MVFVAVTTLYAGWLNLIDTFLPMTRSPKTFWPGLVNSVLTVVILGSALIILAEAVRHWIRTPPKTSQPGHGHRLRHCLRMTQRDFAHV